MTFVEMPILGRLERVDLRDVWTSEASNFTPWLAKEDNLALLGDSIGLDLELEAQEKNVGPFRADILCKDTATEQWVLIENQLESTDHKHLGQLLTYAAGLNAVTIVWIAPVFRDEHRAALDWLNRVTATDVNFFGLEIELWRIGNSMPAPKFNIVSKPNEWVDPLPSTDPTVSVAKQQQLQYWTIFHEYMVSHQSSLKPRKPQPHAWTYFSIGRSKFKLLAAINSVKQRLSVGLVMSGPAAKAHYDLLESQRTTIEAELDGVSLDWKKLPDKQESRIYLQRDNMDPKNPDEWPEQHKWLFDNLVAFYGVFANRVKYLKAVDFVQDTSVDPDLDEAEDIEDDI